MAAGGESAEGDLPPIPRQRRPRWKWALVALVLGMLALLAGMALWLDSSGGHRFLVARIAALEPQSGLRITVGGIDGSIYRRARLRDVRFADPQGAFLSAPLVRLEWWPLSWLSNRLDVDRLEVPRARLVRLPRFNPSESKGPLLPDFDIRLMALRVDRLEVGKAVAGREELLAISGDADIRSGRAVVDLAVRGLRGDDRLLLALDSRPDDNRFDVDLTANAPAGGVLAAMAGLRQGANVRLKGEGDWRRWNGSLVATLEGQPAAGFALAARAGVYSVRGSIEQRALAGQGALGRLAGPQLLLDARGTFHQRRLSGHANLASDSFSLSSRGGFDLGRSRYDNLVLDLRLLRPQALVRNMGGRDVVARARLDGPFSAAGFEYLLSADRLSFGRSVLHGLRASGEGRVAGEGRPTLIPLALRAARLEGQGDLVAGIFRNFRLDGTLQSKGGVVTSSPLRLRSDKLDGTLVALFDLARGRYDLALTGDLRGLAVPGLGVVDVASRIKAVPGVRGSFALSGQVDARMRRFDIAFLRDLAGGMPRVSSGIALGSDGRLLLRDLDVRAPLLHLRGAGERLADGSVFLKGAGSHSRYGPVQLTLKGRIDRPAVDLVLARPLDAAGLAQVRASLVPNAEGYAYAAQGGSTLGPFTSKGRILLPRGGQTLIAIDAVEVGGVRGNGSLMPVTGGLSGEITLNGAVAGRIALAPVEGVQGITLALRARDARFEGAMPVSIRRGNLDAVLKLDPNGTLVDANGRANGVQLGTFRINQLAMNARLKDGAGRVQASLSGQRGRLFSLQLLADVAPEQVTLRVNGTLDREPLSLSGPARLTSKDGGWQLAPVRIGYRGGNATISGQTGSALTKLDLVLRDMPLAVLDISNRDLGLGGKATGRLAYEQRGGAAPTGAASLVVRGLTRSGVTVTSTPVDMGINAQLSATRLALRAVAASGGKTIGRGQALLTPLGGGSLDERLRNAPMQAQLRYSGPADMLWRLSTVEIVDLRGPIDINATVRGTAANPLITGSLATTSASLDSPVTGMRLSGLKAQGRFDGARLVLSSFSGNTRGGGIVTGSGNIDLSLAQGVGIDLRMQATNAELLARDDIGATVTGPIAIRSEGNGGTISGELDVVRSRFTMGRAAAVAQIPELKVIEVNGRREDFDAPRRAAPWRLAIKANARNRLMVDGMGLSSEWRMNLDIGGDVANPALRGTAEMLRGSYDFAGRRFDLTEGEIRFDGSVPTNPRLNIQAEAVVTDLTATIRVTGTSNQPIISFSSVPSLPEDEVLSRVLFGSSITQLSAPEALQLAAAVASLRSGGGGGLDPINAVRKAAGLDRLRILPADSTTGQGTSVAVGKYVTRKTYVELVTDGQGYSATRIEYQVTRWLSLLASISTIGRQSASVRVSRDY